MKTTTENMQTLMKNLRQIFTDVRLLDADTINAIREGAYTSSASDVCYTCNHKHHYARCCAAKQEAVKLKAWRLSFYIIGQVNG